MRQWKPGDDQAEHRVDLKARASPAEENDADRKRVD
jgi:hypothetical protein